MTSAKRANSYNKHAKPSPRAVTTANPQNPTFWDEAMVFPPHGGAASIRRVLQPETAVHGHAFTELVIITDGTGMHAIGGECHALSPGDVFVLRGRMRHAYREPNHLRLINVIIRNSFIETHRAELEEISGGRLLFGKTFTQPRSLCPEELDDCLRLVERIERESAALEPGSVPMQNALLMELLITLCRRAAAPPKSEDLNRMQISRALSFIERHAAKEIGLAEMARTAHMSARSFQRHFRAAVGMPPLRYLQRHRIANCCRLLCETSRSVQSIAAECGIPEPAYFCRLFRQTTGTTPGAFRKRYAHSYA